MARCQYRHELLKTFNSTTGYKCDETEQCWVCEDNSITQVLFEIYSENGEVEHYCPFHAPNKTDDEGILIDAKELQSDLLVKQMKNWILAARNQPNLAFVLPSIHCNSFNVSHLSDLLRLDLHSSQRVLPGAVHFPSSTFTGVCYFENVEFHGCDFSYVKFKNIVSFNKSHFFKNEINNSQSTSFSHAHLNIGDFTSAEFYCPVQFDHAKFNMITFNRTEFGWPVSFRNTTFNRITHFQNIIFKDKTDFSRAHFEHPPEFFESTFHENTDFRGCTFKDRSDRDASPAYRKLKLEMEKIRNRDEEARFFSLEQESKRHQKDTPITEKFFSFFYELISNYGLSVSRPFYSFFFVNVWFFLIYCGYINQIACDTDKTINMFRFTILQIVRPFYIWTTGGLDGVIKSLDCQIENNLIIFQVLATSQSLINISVIALFLLALRRKFKLG